MLLFLFFRQKTAYDVRISDWSSDVCSSDLVGDPGAGLGQDAGAAFVERGQVLGHLLLHARQAFGESFRMTLLARLFDLLARLPVQRVYLLQQRVELIDPLPLLSRHPLSGPPPAAVAAFQPPHRPHTRTAS